MLAHALFYVSRVTFEYFFRILYPLHVFLMTHLPYAHTCAIVDVIVEAFAIAFLLYSFLANSHFATPERVEVLDKFEQKIHGWHVAIRAIIGAELAIDFAGLEYAWEVLVGYDDGGIGLAILQEDVVLGAPLFYEVVLKQECVLLRIDDNVLDVAYVLNQTSSLQVLMFLLEVRRHAPFQLLSLTHIDDGASLVEILVTTRRVGQVADDAFEVFFRLLFQILMSVVISVSSSKTARPFSPSMVSSMMKLM